LRAAYNQISQRKIYEVFGHWPIFDEDGTITDTEALRSILFIADGFFDQFLSELEAIKNKGCGAFSVSMYADVTPGTPITGTTPDGSHWVGTIRSEDTGRVQDPEDDNAKKADFEPVTVATYFSANSSLIESFVNGVLGADPVGAGTHTEVRAGEITGGVRNGSISPDRIDEEAAIGPTGKNADEIAKLVRQNLSQSNYRELSALAATIFGGVAGGSAIGGAAKGTIALGQTIGKSISIGAATGRLSALLEGTRRVVMLPLLAGSETGAININGSKWKFGAFKSMTKWENQMAKRGWTRQSIEEALTLGERFPAVNLVNKGNGAARFVHPVTGQSVVIDTVTGEILQVGGPGFVW